MAPSRQVPDFSKLRVAVVGDLISDHYLVCEPRGLSREAPVMVLRLAFDEYRAGGAANVARNLRALGARTRALGAVGRDPRGRDLIALLESDGIDVGGLVSVPDWITPTKTRVVAAEPRRNLQQVLRIDREPSGPVPRKARAHIAQSLRALAGEIDALVVSDYEYGLLDADVSAAVMELDSAGVPVVFDPRSSYSGFEGVTALTPNVDELARFTGRKPESLENAGELTRAAGEMLARVRSRYLLVTRGNLGMALFGQGLGPQGVAVEASGLGDVTDVSGAGDTAAAVFALALASGLPGPDAMYLANAASGVVVMENGAAVCAPSQLHEALVSAPSPVRLVQAQL